MNMANVGLRLIVAVVLIVMGMGLILLPSYFVEPLSGFGFVYPTDPTTRLLTYLVGGILVIVSIFEIIGLSILLYLSSE